MNLFFYLLLTLAVRNSLMVIKVPHMYIIFSHRHRPGIFFVGKFNLTLFYNFFFDVEGIAILRKFTLWKLNTRRNQTCQLRYLFRSVFGELQFLNFMLVEPTVLIISFLLEVTHHFALNCGDFLAFEILGLSILNYSFFLIINSCSWGILY